jgi:hypothetical protein
MTIEEIEANKAETKQFIENCSAAQLAEFIGYAITTMPGVETAMRKLMCVIVSLSPKKDAV